MRSGLTFLEILTALAVISIAVLTFAHTISRDMQHVRVALWDSIAQDVAQTEIERLSRYGGTDGWDSNGDLDLLDPADEPDVDLLPVCANPPTAGMIFATYVDPVGQQRYPDLTQLPWARGLRCQQPYQSYCLGLTCPVTRLVTVVVQTYYGPLDGSGNPPAGAWRNWRQVTLIGAGGFDRS